MKTSNAIIVTLTASGATASKTWNPENQFAIGHPTLWLLDRTSTGVTVTDTEGTAVRQISEKELSGDATIELAKNFKLQLKELEVLPAVYKTHSGQGELRAYCIRGAWAATSEVVSDHFVARADGARVFTLKKLSDGEYRVTSHSNALEIASKGGSKSSLEKGNHTDFDAKSLAGFTFSQEETSWRFENQGATEGLLQTPVVDPEEAMFRKGVGYSLAAMAALFLIALLIPKNEEFNDQSTRFVFAQKSGKQAAIAQGKKNSDEIPAKGSSQALNPADMGPKAPTGPMAPAQKAKALPMGPEAPKQVAKAEPKKKSEPKPEPKATAKADARHKAMAKALKKIEQSVAKAKPQAKPVKHAIAKAKTAHAVAQSTVKAKPAHKNVAKPAPEKRVDLANTAIGKLLQAQGLKSATRGLEKGGVNSIQGGSSQMAGIAAGQTDLDETAGVASGAGVSARHASVSGLGGGTDSPAGSEVGYGKGSHAAVRGQGNSFVNLDPSGSDVAEGLTKDQVGAVIYKHMSEIRYCYEAAMLRTPDVEGKLAVKFVIGGAGSVKTANVAQSSLGDSKLDDCVMKRLARWQFPHPKGGVDVAVNYPFVFKTLGR